MIEIILAALITSNIINTFWVSSLEKRIEKLEKDKSNKG
jgi:hypothetical protein